MLNCLSVVNRGDGLPQDSAQRQPMAVDLSKVSHATGFLLHDQAIKTLHIIELRPKAKGVNGRGVEILLAQEAVYYFYGFLITRFPIF